MTLTTQAPARFCATLQEVLDANGETTTALAAHDALTVQITGSATSLNLRVQRHPAVGDGGLADGSGPVPNTLSGQWVDAGSAITSLPAIVRFSEPGVAFWRVKAASISGGDATVAISTGA
jgi:hypothetical protein